MRHATVTERTNLSSRLCSVTGSQGLDPLGDCHRLISDLLEGIGSDLWGATTEVFTFTLFFSSFPRCRTCFGQLDLSATSNRYQLLLGSVLCCHPRGWSVSPWFDRDKEKISALFATWPKTRLQILRSGHPVRTPSRFCNRLAPRSILYTGLLYHECTPVG